ncbi:MAG: bifunctional phosphoribosylaminoimidazolecarboxamide formyltransferase/IMP cyclohydrolase, partial [bacterium]
MSDKVRIKRALISVSDKTGLEEFGRQLQELGVEILSTGGTLRKLKEANVQAVSVSTFTGEPEILGGRVKTLHPKVHAGILCRRENEQDIEKLRELEYRLIDLVVVNLYPFQQTLAKPDSDDAEIIENIDIGGPTMVRAAAKNFESVTIITDPADYDKLIEQLKADDRTTDLQFRKECAGKAYVLTAQYDRAVAGYFASGKSEEGALFPARMHQDFSFRTKTRYGENPHQKAALYARDDFKAATLLNAEVLSGKELSFNNYGDLDACLDMLLDFEEPFACVLKHANPCGAAVGATVAEAYQKAYDSDPLSAFGSIIGINKEVDIACAKAMHETPFVECILAPGFSDDAFKLLKKK